MTRAVRCLVLPTATLSAAVSARRKMTEGKSTTPGSSPAHELVKRLGGGEGVCVCVCVCVCEGERGSLDRWGAVGVGVVVG